MFVTGTRTTKDGSVQTDPVIILPAPAGSGDLSSASDVIQSNVNPRSFVGSKLHDAKNSLQENCSSSSSCGSETNTNEKSLDDRRLYRRRQKKSSRDLSSSTASHVRRRNQRWFDGSRPRDAHSLQRKSACGDWMREVTPHSRAPSSLVPPLRISGHFSRRDGQNLTPCGQPAVNSSQNAHNMSLKSRCPIVKNRYAADMWNHPQVAGRARQNAEVSASGRLHSQDGNSERERFNWRPQSDERRVHFSHVGVMTPSSSIKPRSRKYPASDAAEVSRPKYARPDRLPLNNWQPRHDQSLPNHSHGLRPVWLPPPTSLLPSFFRGVPVLFPRLPSVLPAPSVFFPSLSIPIPLWSWGRLW